MKIYIKDKIIKLILTKSKNVEMCLELMGILASCNMNAEWTDILLANDKFLDFMEVNMLNAASEDDFLMEILALISNICKEA